MLAEMETWKWNKTEPPKRQADEVENNVDDDGAPFAPELRKVKSTLHAVAHIYNVLS